MTTLRDSIDAAKARLPLPALLSRLNLTEHARTSATCPLHQDRAPSFSVWRGPHGWRWKCHAGCGEGDEIDFLERLQRTDRAAALHYFLELANCAPAPRAIRSPSKSPQAAGQNGPRLPDDATPGTEADWRALAALRKIDYLAPAKAAQLGALYFGTVCGERCWIITDERRLCAEARRMDGRPFPAIGELRERKAHAIRGTVKSWPAGLHVRGFTPADFRALLIVEGGPDYLAALHFALAGSADCLPVAFLGAGVASAIHTEALPHFRGRRVRLYPHHDPGRQGDDAADRWMQQLNNAGADTDAAVFDGLRKADGSAVKDLNDCTQLHPEDAAELEGLLP